MQGLNGGVQIIIGLVVVFFNGGLFIYILKAFKTQIDCKADKVLTEDRHTRIMKDLDEGRDEFKELRKAINNVSDQQGKTNNLLTAIKTRIDDHLSLPKSQAVK